VQALVTQGNIAVGRRLALELARWFPEHTDAMDRGLAQWVLKQRLGGVRVSLQPRRPQV
jgi:hemerythrin